MMYFKAVLACALVAAVSGQSVSGSASVSGSGRWIPSFSTGMLGTMNGIGSAAKGTIDMINTTGQTINAMTSQGMLGGAELAQKGVNLGTGLASTGLTAGVQMVKGVSDIVSNAAGMVPVVGDMVKVGSGMVGAGADVVNAVGQNVLNLANGVENAKMQMLGGLVKAGSQLNSNTMSLGTDMAKAGVDTGLKITQGVVGTLGNVLDQTAGSLPWVGGAFSSASGGSTSGSSSSISGGSATGSASSASGGSATGGASGSASAGTGQLVGGTGSGSVSSGLGGGLGAAFGNGLSAFAGLGSGLLKAGQAAVSTGTQLAKQGLSALGSASSGLGLSASGSVSTRSLSPRMSPNMQTVF